MAPSINHQDPAWDRILASFLVPREPCRVHSPLTKSALLARQEPEDSGKWKVRVDIRHLGVSVSTNQYRKPVNRTFPAGCIFRRRTTCSGHVSPRLRDCWIRVFFDPDEDVPAPQYDSFFASDVSEFLKK